jgi:hypothetical protein
MKAPAGGAIVGNQFQQGGRFLPRAFARVKTVMDRLRAQRPAQPQQPVKMMRFETVMAGAGGSRHRTHYYTSMGHVLHVTPTHVQHFRPEAGSVSDPASLYHEDPDVMDRTHLMHEAAHQDDTHRHMLLDYLGEHPNEHVRNVVQDFQQATAQSPFHRVEAIEPTSYWGGMEGMNGGVSRRFHLNDGHALTIHGYLPGGGRRPLLPPFFYYGKPQQEPVHSTTDTARRLAEQNPGAPFPVGPDNRLQEQLPHLIHSPSGDREDNLHHLSLFLHAALHNPRTAPTARAVLRHLDPKYHLAQEPEKHAAE